MIIQAYGAALLIVAASVIVGRAICVLVGGRDDWWAAPGIGFAALIVLAMATFELPGAAVPAVAATGLLVVLSGSFLLLRRTRLAGVAELIAGLAALAATTVPFVTNGRVGLPGVSLDDDTATFLLYTEGLRSTRMHQLWGPSNGYPLGPHSVAAAVSSATGIGLDMALTGLMIAIVAIMAMIGAGILGRRGLWLRAGVGLMCSLPYMAAAYYAEGSFKETVMAALLLAFVVHLDSVRDRLAGAGVDRYARALLAILLLPAAGIYTYSYEGAAWFVGTVVIWGLAEAIAAPRRARGWVNRGLAIRAAPWVSGGLLVMALLLAPVADQLSAFFTSVGGVSPASGSAIPQSALGNLAHPLSVYESFGIWWSGDFRFSPANAFHAGELGAFALAMLIFALLAAAHRRRLLLPAAVLASLLIWWRANGTQSPYLAAKGLVIAAPLIMALDLRELLSIPMSGRAVRALMAAVTIFFIVAAAYSSELVLRNVPVGAPESGGGLSAFRRYVGTSPVLYLGNDQYASWELRPAAVSALDPNILGLGQAIPRYTGGPLTGQLDFDSVVPSSLDRFSYVITSNTPYASQAPSDFRLVATSRMYELWRRTGPTPPRLALEPSGAPGLLVDCRDPVQKALSRRRGVASVMPTPVTAAGPGLMPGASATVKLPLAAGRWELSLQYVSNYTLDVSAEGHRWSMPPLLGVPGPFFAVGQLVGTGAASPVLVTLHLHKPSALTGAAGLEYAGIPMLAATRFPDSRQLVPLHRICGRYVDWYRISTGGR